MPAASSAVYNQPSQSLSQPVVYVFRPGSPHRIFIPSDRVPCQIGVPLALFFFFLLFLGCISSNFLMFPPNWQPAYKMLSSKILVHNIMRFPFSLSTIAIFCLGRKPVLEATSLYRPEVSFPSPAATSAEFGHQSVPRDLLRGPKRLAARTLATGVSVETTGFRMLSSISIFETEVGRRRVLVPC
ncbi:hypothetical protein SAY87_020486 [Trapa incisa]|uniref:Uncharacterized protein n=1 Tax=Trapa incisa TaxID=236973 RepID=A0AAN7JVU3_9MYRT|nr:hypothetical protein SAY87_020486 [Trapa incisa]